MNNHTKVLEAALGRSFISGNHIDVLRNGNEIFPAMLDAIEKSLVSIDLVTFVYWSGNIAEQFATALSTRASAGVKVRVLLDAYGCGKLDNGLIEMMQQAGVEIHWFRPLSQWKIWKWDNRTHRKIMICDLEVAFTGGVGIAEEWEGDAQSPSDWRDTHFKITGPAIINLYSGFLTNWSEANDSGIIKQNPFKLPNKTGNANIQVIHSPSSINWSDIAILFRLLVTNAKKSIRITTAYFVPDETLTNLLCSASERGVEIKIMVPGKHTDQRFCQLSGENRFRQLLKTNIEIYQYEPTMLHTKVMLVDEMLAVIGSANMNHRSMSKDEETCLVIEDKDSVSSLNQDFTDDLNNSQLLDISTWRDRSIWQRCGEFFSNLFRHEL